MKSITALLAGIVLVPLVTFAATTGSATTAPAASPRTDIPDTPKMNSLPAATSQTQSLSYKVNNLACEGCESRVKSAIAKIPGVSSVTANARTGDVTMTFENSSKVDRAAVVRAIEGEGFTVVR
jgi:copper chaperone CopZ